MTYPFAGEIKMTKVIKDGEEVIEWEQVDMSKHSEGNLGIGDGKLTLDGVVGAASAPLVMGTMPTGNIYFFGTAGNSTEVLRLSREGIWANPDVPVDEAAKLVLEAIDDNIKVLVQKAVEEEREACAYLCDRVAEENRHVDEQAELCAFVIRERGAP